MLSTAQTGCVLYAVCSFVQVPSVLVLDVEHATGVDKTKLQWKQGRDHWYHEVIPAQKRYCAPEWVPAEHPLYLLYTSGSTGKPKGIQVLSPMLFQSLWCIWACTHQCRGRMLQESQVSLSRACGRGTRGL